MTSSKDEHRRIAATAATAERVFRWAQSRVGPTADTSTYARAVRVLERATRRLEAALQEASDSLASAAAPSPAST